MVTDKERQEDEIFALQNICDSDEFRYNRNANECFFSITCHLSNENLLLKYTTNVEDMKEQLYIKYLPRIRLYVQLPFNYPSTTAPHYRLAINWLPPWEVSLACQKLDQLWQDHQFNEILFIWLEFLKSELLNYLNIKDILEVSYFFDLYENSTNKFFLEVLEWSDNRVVYGGLFLNPVEKLLDYNELRETWEFQTNIQECGICFGLYSGKMCIRVSYCKHIFCKDCILQFLNMKINERDINGVKCPGYDCKRRLGIKLLREICSSDMFEKYNNYFSELMLMKTKNLIYCPRKICQAPVTTKDGDNLASCSNCEYNFCRYCLKVYHGITACDMDSEKKLKLIEEYEKGDKSQKKFLEKKYGRHQIREIIEKQLTNEYIKETTKTCPTCGILTSKISGCNLIECLRCHTSFCWLCNSKIISKDPYDHFKSSKNGPCFNRLFEGVDESEEFHNFIDDFEIAQNFEYFIDSD